MNTHTKLGFLDKLRSKPASYKRTFAILVSLGFTLIILAVWLVSTISRLSSTDNLAGVAATASSSLSAFSVIQDRFSQFVGNGSDTTNSDQNLVQ